MTRMPKAIFISHGGGPLPLLGDSNHSQMVSALQTLATAIPRPKALVVVSAHWEADVPTITSAQQPPLIYDYYGFPPESYKIQYPCSGDPPLSEDVFRLLDSNGIKARLDNERGLDHGAFIPLKLMYPEANIPCVQLSLVNTLDPAKHIDIGTTLRDLHKQEILLIGSGFSFHNMHAFFKPNNENENLLNEAFENWLEEVCADNNLPESERTKQLINWSAAPGARYCHPREEHLIPLHVCYGAAQSACTKHIKVNIMNKSSSFYVW